jgi:hypothetical protein
MATTTVPARAAAERQQVLDRVRRAARYRWTATVLERRACRSANPAVADLLRECAAARREAAARARAELTGAA